MLLPRHLGSCPDLWFQEVQSLSSPATEGVTESLRPSCSSHTDFGVTLSQDPVPRAAHGLCHSGRCQTPCLLCLCVVYLFCLPPPCVRNSTNQQIRSRLLASSGEQSAGLCQTPSPFRHPYLLPLRASSFSLSEGRK